MKKQVVASIAPVDVVTVDEVDERKFYGLWEKYDHNRRGFIMRGQYGHGNFIPYCTDAMTIGNNYCDYKGSTLAEVVRRVLAGNSFHQYEVFEFDTAKELFAWLAN